MKRKKLAGLLALFLCFSLLAACAPGTEPEPQSQPSQSKTAQSSELLEQNQTEPAENEQTTDLESTEAPIHYTGEAEVKDLYRSEGETAYGVTTEISFPCIALPGEDVAALNLEFLQSYMKYVNEDGVFEISKAPAHSYKWYVNGDILSLVIETQDFVREYTVYNIRISTCKLITADEVLAAAGVSAEDFYGKSRDILGSAYYTEDFLPYLDASDEGTSSLFYS